MHRIVTVLVAALLFLTPLLAQDVRQPRQKIELGDVTLLDGRVLKDAKLLSATQKGLNIAHASGMEQISRSNFTPEFLAKYQDAIAAADDEYQAEAALRQRHHQEKMVEESNRKIRQRQAQAAAKKQEIEAQKKYQQMLAGIERERALKEEAEARRAAFKAAELARARDGVILEMLTRYYEGCDLTVRNVQDNPRRFDWRELRARKTDGRLVIPVNCESADERDRSLDIRPDEKRAFRVRFMGGNDDIEAITWSDGGQEIEPYRPAPKKASVASTVEAP